VTAAVLRIGVEGGADIRRSLGVIVAEARRANSTISADARRGSRERTRDSEREARDAARVFERSMQSRRRLQRETSRDATTASRARVRDEQGAATHIARLDSTLTRTAHAESNNRRRIAREEARERERSADRAAAATERAERRVTRATREAYQDRRRLERASQADSRRFTGGARAALGWASNAASGIHGAVQGARAQYAGGEHGVNNALFQAGGGAGEARGFRNSIFSFLQGAGRGLTFDQVSGALQAGQTEFSVLGNRGPNSNPQTRAAALQDALGDMALARNTYQDPGEVLRVSGLLRQQGLTPQQRRSTLLALSGMAQAGAVELSGVTRTAMGPIQARIGQALAAMPRGASERDRQAAVQRTIGQGLAEIEVARGLGVSPRMAGNVMAVMGTALQSDVTQSRMLTNIRSARNPAMRALESTLFSRDSHGRSSLNQEFRDPLTLIQRMGELGVTGVQAQNLFAGSGRGNPQSMQANWRRLMGSMLGEDAEGTPAWERVRRLQSATTPLTEDDLRRGASMIESEAGTDINANDARRMSTLTDNTAALVSLSIAMSRWQADHPFLDNTPMPGMPGGGGGGGGVIAGIAGGAVPTALAGAGGVGVAAGVSGMALALGGAFVGTDIASGGKSSDTMQRLMGSDYRPSQATRGGGLTNIADRGVWRDVQSWFMPSRPDRVADSSHAAMKTGSAGDKSVAIRPADIAALATALGAAIRANPPAVAPHDVVHAASAAQSHRPGRTEGN